MAYISSVGGGIISVDAILTNKGRASLAKGLGLPVTQYAISDDEVDYGLYNEAHPLGSAFYGSAIENLPLVEASVDETQVMKYKLVTLPRGTATIPLITIGFTNISLTAGQSNAIPISPSTTAALNGPGFGYTAILVDADAAVLVGTGIAANVTGTSPSFFGDAGNSNAVVAVGLQFTLTPKNVPVQVNTQLIITGNQSGASITIPVIVYPASN